MILTRNEIIKAVRSKTIHISPFSLTHVGPGSYDLTLSSEFWMFKKNSHITLTENIDFKKYTQKKKMSTVVLNPGDFVLGISKEKITLPTNMCALLSGRSRFARLGIEVHATASFVQPGISNRQVFEIKNTGYNTLILKPGLRLAQIIFIRTEGQAKYKGKFRNQ